MITKQEFYIVIKASGVEPEKTKGLGNQDANKKMTASVALNCKGDKEQNKHHQTSIKGNLLKCIDLRYLG